ncbi:lysophospholipid acyltransferase family protein [Tateyamaria sp. ANG-S1]|uniref:lysophospholipid acyltransferase family protein n=1 Tax=Tateyamaria sp. ANG-S1 TaxID=1577905 RepID=UPI00057C42BF|nr:lysophospholipid acyltransferase family protein [Tateyamaria sp. ANG-S1]KIC51289.1 glycerol acyltransferase [Tateyamaria sp. ANG-S1]
MIQYLRSLVFVLHIYVMMLVIGVVFAPYAIVSKNGARAACKTYSRYVFWSMRWMVGLKAEVRGEVPEGEVLIASKHQSFLDIMMIFTALPSAKFIMKRSILWTPIIGLYAKRLECVPVDRGKRGAAIAKMVRDVEAGRASPGQLIIYSQGTRVAPGTKAPYKVGTAVLYEQLGQPCVPVATNVGVFWPRTGIMRKPGTAIVEFLPALEEGLDRDTFLSRLEDTVEERSDALMREGGFEPNGVH